MHAGIVLLAALAASCGGDAPPTAVQKGAVPARALPQPRKGPTAEELTAGMVEAAELDKAAAPVNLKFELTDKPKVGQLLEINLALLSKLPLASGDVQVSGADGFELPPGAGHFEIPETDVDDVFRHTLRLKPVIDGVLFVALTVSSRHDDVVEAKGFSIPIIVQR